MTVKELKSDVEGLVPGWGVQVTLVVARRMNAVLTVMVYTGEARATAMKGGGSDGSEEHTGGQRRRSAMTVLGSLRVVSERK